MADPLTANTIIALALQEFVKSGAGELAKKFTTSEIAKISELRKTIWDRLRGKYDKAQEFLPKAETGDKQAIDTIAKLLNSEMSDAEFAKDIQAIVQEINAAKLQNFSSTKQDNRDSSTGHITTMGDSSDVRQIGDNRTYNITNNHNNPSTYQETCHNIPSTYQQTCHNIQVEDGVLLSATCKRFDGTLNKTSIRIPGIENIDGVLTINNHNNPSTYQETCHNIQVEGGVLLSATCKRLDGTLNKTSIRIPGIENIDGVLMFRR